MDPNNSSQSPDSVADAVIDLCDDNEDDRKMPAAPPVLPAQPQPAIQDVTGLVSTPISEEQLEKRRRERLARKALRYDPKKKQKKNQLKEPPKLVTGAGSWAKPVELDIDAKQTPPATIGKDPWENYRKIMGPLRFDVVQNKFKSSHSFLKQRPSPPVKLPVNRLFKEYTSYRTVLPVECGSSVFVRVLEDRLDLVRFLITGPQDTPYQSGCFLFDMLVGENYPANPPKVKFLTTGGGKVRFNPNLYNCGKVCLSLLGTWSGPGWQAKKSTLLQVLVSIQGLILVGDPYFNEPGFESSRGSAHANRESTKYNTNIRRQTLQHAILPFLDSANKQGGPYPEFNTVVTKHYVQCADSLEKQLVEWEKEDKSLKLLTRQVRDKLHELLKSNPLPVAPPAAATTATDETIVIE